MKQSQWTARIVTKAFRLIILLHKASMLSSTGINTCSKHPLSSLSSLTCQGCFIHYYSDKMQLTSIGFNQKTIEWMFEIRVLLKRYWRKNCHDSWLYDAQVCSGCRTSLARICFSKALAPLGTWELSNAGIRQLIGKRELMSSSYFLFKATA